jgi:hypothetical protein
MIRTICAVVLLGLATPASAETLKLASTYDEAGTNPNGSKYTGTATIQILSDTTFAIQWTVGDTTFSGFGMRRDDNLAATYMINGQPGLMIYKVGEDGVLNGLWAVRGRDGNGTDRLTPRN